MRKNYLRNEVFQQMCYELRKTCFPPTEIFQLAVELVVFVVSNDTTVHYIIYCEIMKILKTQKCIKNKIRVLLVFNLG